MYERKSIGVIVPAYNEEGFVGDVIDTMPNYVDRVYIVDDGSTDGTWEEIQRHVSLARSDSPEGSTFERRFVPIRHEENLGAGAALKTGYERSRTDRMDVTAVMAGDGQMDPAILPNFLDPVVSGDVDYTKGNRFHGTGVSQTMPTIRVIGSLILTILTRIASGYWGMRDSQNGYTAISLSALDEIALDELVDGFGTPNELLVRLNANEMQFTDIPMPANYGNEESHLRYRSYVFLMLGLLARNFVWRLREKYYRERVYSLPICYAVGVSSLVIGVSLGVLDFIGHPLTGSLLVPDGSTTWLLVGGCFLLIGAMTLDWKYNDHLQVPSSQPQKGNV